MQTLEDLRTGKLQGVTRLKLSDKLDTLPEEVFGLADSLEILDLNGTGLSELPADFGRLKKLRILFMSDNPVETLPEVLADCPALSMIGFKNCHISDVPHGAIPKTVNWLILTGNRISELPASVGELPRLQKCMLAGNQLSTLPDTFAGGQNLELLRLSANRFEALPDFLFSLPKLSWLTFAGNPLHKSFGENANIPVVTGDALEFGETLGEGASGVIRKARWKGETEPVAVKLFKGALTSDGFAEDELNATLAAGNHDGLVPIRARLKDDDLDGLIMPVIPGDFSALGNPPTFDTCTRDHYPDDFRISADKALRIARQQAGIMLHLRERNIAHNDFYPHNILTNPEGESLLTDFGAAANYASLPDHQRHALERIEARAFGCLVDDLINGLSQDDLNSSTGAKLIRLRDQLFNETVSSRPGFSDIVDALA